MMYILWSGNIMLMVRQHIFDNFGQMRLVVAIDDLESIGQLKTNYKKVT